MTELILYRANSVRNGNFSSSNLTGNDWISQVDPGLTSWVVSNNTVKPVYSATQYANLYQECLEPNAEYTLTFNVTGLTSGTMEVHLGDNNQVGTVASNGSYSFTGTATGPDSTLLVFKASNFFNGSISNVVAKIVPVVMNLDLTKGIQIPLTYKISDIADISTRKGSYSKTIVIPGTKRNDIAFNHIYEIDGSGKFNPNKKIDAAVIEEGITVFQGILKLNKINRIQNGNDAYDKVTYDCTLSSSVIDVMGSLKNLKLTDLDFSEYDHQLTRRNQVFSWATSVIKNGVATPHFVNGTPYTILSSGLHTDGRLKIEFTTPHGFSNGDQVYIKQNQTNLTSPYLLFEGDHKVHEVLSSTEVSINIPYDTVYGTALTGTVFTHVPTGEGYVYTHVDLGEGHYTSFEGGGTVWTVPQFTPVLFVKEYIDKMLKKIGITYTSDFFESPMFKRLVVPPSGLGFRLSEAEIASRTFKAGQNVDDFHTFTMKPNNTSPSLYTSHIPINNYYNCTTTSSVPLNPALPVCYDGILRFPVKFNDDTTPPWADPNADYSTSTYEWTCPATGTYDLNVEGILATATNLPSGIEFVTSPTTPAYDNAVLGIAIVHTYNVPASGSGGSATSIGGIVGEIANTVHTDYYTASANFEGDITIASTYPTATLYAGNKYRVYVTLHIANNGISGTGFGNPWTPWLKNTATSASLGWDYPYQSNFDIQLGMRANATFSTSFTNTVHLEGETVSMQGCIPTDVTCADFFKSIISMFNLYITGDPDNDHNLIIETRNDYYSGGDINVWTKKLDPSQTLEITPSGLLVAKNYEFAYKEDKDYFNTKHVTEGGIIYGNYIKTIDSDFLTNTTKTELIFSPSVLADFNGTGWVLSTMVGSNLAPPQPRIETKVRILYYSLSSIGKPWIHYSGVDTVYNSTMLYNYGDFVVYSGSRYKNITGVNGGVVPSLDPTNWQTGSPAYIQDQIKYRYVTPYPYVGHLDKVALPDLDLNWYYPVKVYYNYKSWTDNNLYNTYYNDMITEVVDKDSKVISGYFYLKPEDISKLNFRDKFLVDGHYLRLIEISDYSVGGIKPVKCTFIKIESGIKFNGKSFILFEGQQTEDGTRLPEIIGQGKLSTVSVSGQSNQVSSSALGVLIEGNENTVGDRTSNIVMLNSSQNTVGGGLSNVTLINTNGMYVNQSNVTYVNGILMNQNFEPVTTVINFIDAGYNEVLNPFGSATTVNLVDAGTNNVLDIGSANLINFIEVVPTPLTDNDI